MKTALQVRDKIKELKLKKEENAEAIKVLNWVYFPSTPLLTEETLTMLILYLEGKSDREIGELFGISLQLARKYITQLKRIVRKHKTRLGLPVVSNLKEVAERKI